MNVNYSTRSVSKNKLIVIYVHHILLIKTKGLSSCQNASGSYTVILMAVYIGLFEFYLIKYIVDMHSPETKLTSSFFGRKIFL